MFYATPKFTFCFNKLFSPNNIWPYGRYKLLTQSYKLHDGGAYFIATTKVENKLIYKRRPVVDT